MRAGIPRWRRSTCLCVKREFAGGPTYYTATNEPLFWNDKGWVSLTFAVQF